MRRGQIFGAYPASLPFPQQCRQESQKSAGLERKEQKTNELDPEPQTARQSSWSYRTYFLLCPLKLALPGHPPWEQGQLFPCKRKKKMRWVGRRKKERGGERGQHSLPKKAGPWPSPPHALRPFSRSALQKVAHNPSGLPRGRHLAADRGGRKGTVLERYK